MKLMTVWIFDPGKLNASYIRRSKMVAFIAAMVLLYVTANYAQDALGAKLDQPVKVTNFSEANVKDFIYEFVDKYDIRFGIDGDFVEAASLRKAPKTCYVGPNATVRGFLDAFSSCFTDYEWNQAEGVINISRKTPGPPHPLLDACIADFEFDGDDLMAFKRAIIRSPEVQLSVQSRGFQVRELRLSQQPEVDTIAHGTLRLRNVSVREVLNEGLRRSFYRHWSVSTWGTDKDIWIILMK